MIENAIRERVQAYYARQSGVLLLSELGEYLRDAQLWPIEGDSRTLADLVSGTEGVSVVRDDKQKAFIVVVLKGEEHKAEAVIKIRNSDKILRRLPRSVLVAFCVDTDADDKVYLQTQAPFRYMVSRDTGPEGYVLIEENYRMPGVLVEDLKSLSPEETNQLAEGFLAWCDEHGLQSANFVKTPVKPRASGPDMRALSSAARLQAPATAAANALERLLAAQVPEIASKIQIPADIALTLSRIP